MQGLKLRRFLVLSVVVLGLAANVPAAEPAPAAVHQQAKTYADAILTGKFETFIDLMPARVVSLLGGRKVLLESLRRDDAQMRADGVRVIRFAVAPPTQIVAGGPDWFAVLPTTVSMSVRDSKLTLDGYLLGISTDGGKRWTFVDGAGIGQDREKLKELFANAPASLKLPEKPSPAGAPNQE